MDNIAKDPENFNILKDTISKVAEFNCSQYTDSFITRRIEVRLRFHKLETFKEYSDLLLKDHMEVEKLKKELTIHTTNFFRDISLYNKFMEDIIPKVVEIKKESKKINIWSAGASTGEEALTIAICFVEKLGPDLQGYEVKIFGTDRDLGTVKKAREGMYEENQFREMPSEYKAKYFEKVDDIYKAKEVVKKLITFEMGDILARQKSGMDIIFCRNTVIYFDNPTKSKLYEDIYNILPEKGFFIMGKTEVLHGDSRDKFNIYNFDERIYQK